MLKATIDRLDPSGRIKRLCVRRGVAAQRLAKRRLGLPGPPQGINLVGYLAAEMGLGEAGRALASALRAGGVPFDTFNLEAGNPSRHTDTTWKHKEVARAAYDITLLAVNPDNAANIRVLLREKALTNRYTIGYWFWELPELPEQWIYEFSLVDEVWVATRHVQDTFSLKSPVPVFRVPLPVSLDVPPQFSRASFNLPERSFLFLSMSDTLSRLQRKNPLGAIKAFKKSFAPDDLTVGLVVKLNNPTFGAEEIAALRAEAAPFRNIYLLDRCMSRAEINALIWLSDCFVSLHRAEGFGLGPAEAMRLGKPAIITNWSGNTDYMTPRNSIGISYRLVTLEQDDGMYPSGQHWADPDLDEAAYWMKKLTAEPELVGQIGAAARQTMCDHFSPESVGNLIKRRLQYIRKIL